MGRSLRLHFGLGCEGGVRELEVPDVCVLCVGRFGAEDSHDVDKFANVPLPGDQDLGFSM